MSMLNLVLRLPGAFFLRIPSSFFEVCYINVFSTEVKREFSNLRHYQVANNLLGLFQANPAHVQDQMIKP
jgi:hypothetical protein